MPYISKKINIFKVIVFDNVATEPKFIKILCFNICVMNA